MVAPETEHTTTPQTAREVGQEALASFRTNVMGAFHSALETFNREVTSRVREGLENAVGALVKIGTGRGEEVRQEAAEVGNKVRENLAEFGTQVRHELQEACQTIQKIGAALCDAVAVHNSNERNKLVVQESDRLESGFSRTLKDAFDAHSVSTEQARDFSDRAGEITTRAADKLSDAFETGTVTEKLKKEVMAEMREDFRKLEADLQMTVRHNELLHKDAHAASAISERIEHSPHLTEHSREELRRVLVEHQENIEQSLKEARADGVITREERKKIEKQIDEQAKLMEKLVTSFEERDQESASIRSAVTGGIRRPSKTPVQTAATEPQSDMPVPELAE
jgi:hypothetical protein